MKPSPSARRSAALRQVLGLGSLGLLVLMALFIPRWGGLRQKAIVEAEHTFRLGALSEGQHQWSLRSGWAAEGEALVREQLLQMERSDLVELEINPALSPGDAVEKGQVVAWLRSPRDRRRLQEVQALRDELVAQQALLQAGQSAEEVAEARQRLELARATWEGHQPQLERARRLAQEDALSTAELETAEVQDELLRLEVDVARAALDVARASARPEAIDAVSARIAAAEARMGELEDRLYGQTIRSPIAGMLEMGGRRVVLRVYDLDPVYLRMAIPEADRHRVRVGAPLRFHSPAVTDTEFQGQVVDISEDAAGLNGAQVFWVSAEVPNPDLALRSGMSGVVRVDLEGSRRGFLSSVWSEIMGYGP